MSIWHKWENKEMGTHSQEPLNSLSVRKSNDFISAKYKSSLLENQVMAIALTRIEVNAKDIDAPLEARLYPGELKKLVSDPAHIYRDLKKLAKTITGHTMFLEDGKGNFKAFSVVPNADYIDGVFIIKFNNELRNHVLGLEKNYTNLELAVMTDFKRNTSFRLYEVLKKEAYKIPKGSKEAYIQVEYNICELRFIIGLANSDDPIVKNAMANMGKLIDWDALYEKLDKKDKKYEEWRDFQRRVIKPAQEELEEKSDIRFEYEGIREGRRTKRIIFTIYNNIPRNPSIIDERKMLLDSNSVKNRQLELPMDIYPQLYEDFVGHNHLEKEDITLLIEKANGNEDKVRRAIEMADCQENITNYMGWLIRCIEQDYMQTETILGSSEKVERVQEIRKIVNDNMRTGTIQQAVWNKTKSKEDFIGFEKMLSDNGLSLEQIEAIYSCDEMVQMYADWILGRYIEF